MSDYIHTPASSVGSSLRRFSPALLLAVVAMLVAGATQASARGVDLRSPDTRDVAPAQNVDLRSPDARDAGRVPPQPVASSQDSSDDFEWVYAGIIVAGVVLLAGAVAITVRRRHRTTSAASA